MAAPIILTELSSGAPTLNGVNGALTAVLRWALVQAGWAVEYGASGNAAVFRPGSGNRFRLHVNHDSTVSGSAAAATVRGCENASAATTLVDAFPTVAQVANNAATWYLSQTTGSTARRYKIYLWPTFFILLIETNSSGEWDVNFFGDVEGGRTEDVYDTVISTRNSTNIGSVSFGWIAQAAADRYPVNLSLTSRVFWCRDISGVYKSTKGCIGLSGNYLGSVTAAMSVLGGYGNRIEREKVAIHCSGDNSAGSANGIAVQARRGWLRNLWSLMHSSYAAVSSEDTFADSEYNASSAFVLFKGLSTNHGYAIETTDTWSPPSG